MYYYIHKSSNSIYTNTYNFNLIPYWVASTLPWESALKFPIAQTVFTLTTKDYASEKLIHTIFSGVSPASFSSLQFRKGEREDKAFMQWLLFQTS